MKPDPAAPRVRDMHFTDEENAVIEKLKAEMELSQIGVLRQGLRILQAVRGGAMFLYDAMGKAPESPNLANPENRQAYEAGIALGRNLSRMNPTPDPAAPRVDFTCKVCGRPTDIAPDLPERAVCPDHCGDHSYVYIQGERRHACEHCGQERPYDWNY